MSDPRIHFPARIRDTHPEPRHVARPEAKVITYRITWLNRKQASHLDILSVFVGSSSTALLARRRLPLDHRSPTCGTRHCSLRNPWHQASPSPHPQPCVKIAERRGQFASVSAAGIEENARLCHCTSLSYRALDRLEDSTRCWHHVFINFTPIFYRGLFSISCRKSVAISISQRSASHQLPLLRLTSLLCVRGHHLLVSSARPSHLLR